MDYVIDEQHHKAGKILKSELNVWKCTGDITILNLCNKKKNMNAFIFDNVWGHKINVFQYNSIFMGS